MVFIVAAMNGLGKWRSRKCRNTKVEADEAFDALAVGGDVVAKVLVGVDGPLVNLLRSEGEHSGLDTFIVHGDKTKLGR